MNASAPAARLIPGLVHNDLRSAAPHFVLRYGPDSGFR